MKIFSRDTLRKQVGEWRHAGEQIVLANGCFDLLHVGHVRYLSGAKALGGKLIVAMNSDASVRQIKGRRTSVHARAGASRDRCRIS